MGAVESVGPAGAGLAGSIRCGSYRDLRPGYGWLLGTVGNAVPGVMGRQRRLATGLRLQTVAWSAGVPRPSGPAQRRECCSHVYLSLEVGFLGPAGTRQPADRVATPGWVTLGSQPGPAELRSVGGLDVFVKDPDSVACPRSIPPTKYLIPIVPAPTIPPGFAAASTTSGKDPPLIKSDLPRRGNRVPRPQACACYAVAGLRRGALWSHEGEHRSTCQDRGHACLHIQGHAPIHLY